MPFETSYGRDRAAKNEKTEEKPDVWTWKAPSFYALASCVISAHEKDILLGNVEDALASKTDLAETMEAVCTSSDLGLVFAVTVAV